ncbi:MAG: M24 family metallopeptidase [Fimbriimonadaceae bacterium]|nr:M24 family metallopeptidase [Fimbriimonadaceae bacterium]
MTALGTDRTQRLAAQLQSEGFDAYFASIPVSMGYLHGFAEDGHERLLLMAIRNTGEVRLICPALAATQARRCGISDIRPWTDGEDPLDHIRELSQDWNLRSGMIAVDNELRADILLALQDTLPAALFKAGEPVLSLLMMRKDGMELELMKRAADIADAAYERVKPQLRVGLTEKQVGNLLREAMSALGGEPTFAIVATGANGAEPHHLNDDTPLAAGDVVILDFGCQVQGYQSDITRTVAIQSASDRAREVYGIVYASHMAGRNRGMAGVACGEVDQAARDAILAGGFGEYFVHRTGHGIGMKGHEAPYISPKNPFVLEVGNCFSIEPGIYLPGEFGVRIENIVTAREGDSLSLNAEPTATIEVVGN